MHPLFLETLATERIGRLRREAHEHRLAAVVVRLRRPRRLLDGIATRRRLTPKATCP
jgi:hypothetical protein